MTQKKTNSIVPQEYVDKMQEYNIDDWRKQKIADALKYQAERETGADVPSWWSDGEDPYFHSKRGLWKNCISTATSSFGEKYCEIGNQTFINPNSKGYFVKKGFRELTDADNDQYGDIWVDYDEIKNTPFHALMLTGHDENGTPTFTYGSGWQDGIKKDANYKFEKLGKKYRFVGTPEDIAEIEAHNAKVKEYKKETAPLREKREVTRLDVEPLKKSLMEEGLQKHLQLKKTYE